MAKPLTRVARRIARAMGYELLRQQKTTIHDESVTGLGRGGGLDAFEVVVPREVAAFDIYFRSCARVDVHAQSRARFNGAPKSEIVTRCLVSLGRSIAYARDHGESVPMSLTVLDDHSDPESVEKIKAALSSVPVETGFLTIEGTGPGISMAEACRMARDQARDIYYIVEDDYLHDERAVLEVVASYRRLAGMLHQDIMLFTADYPDFYRNVRPTQVLLGSHRHWRRIDSVTFSHIASKKILTRYWDKFIMLERYGEDPDLTEANSINKVVEQVPTFAPLPALAAHFQHFETMSPFFDWEKWWENSRLVDAPETETP